MFRLNKKTNRQPSIDLLRRSATEMIVDHAAEAKENHSPTSASPPSPYSSSNSKREIRRSQDSEDNVKSSHRCSGWDPDLSPTTSVSSASTVASPEPFNHESTPPSTANTTPSVFSPKPYLAEIPNEGVRRSSPLATSYTEINIDASGSRRDSPAFDIPILPTSQTTSPSKPTPESSQRSPVTTACSSRNSSLGEDPVKEATDARLASENVIHEKLPAVKEGSVWEGGFDSPKSPLDSPRCSSPLPSLKHTSSLFATKAARRHSSNPSFAETVTFDDSFTSIERPQVKECHPSSAIVGLEKWMDFLPSSTLPIPQPPSSLYPSCNSSAESLLGLHSPLISDEDVPMKLAAVRDWVKEVSMDKHSDTSILDLTELDMKLKRAKSFADITQRPPRREDTPDITMLPSIESGLHSSSPVPFKVDSSTSLRGSKSIREIKHRQSFLETIIAC